MDVNVESMDENVELGSAPPLHHHIFVQQLHIYVQQLHIYVLGPHIYVQKLSYFPTPSK